LVTVREASVNVRIVVLLFVGTTVVPTVKKPQANVPVPAIEQAIFPVTILFIVTAPVTVRATPEIVNVEFPVKVKDAIEVARAELRVGSVAVAGIITMSVATVPG
jgi:hypothetical protein